MTALLLAFLAALWQILLELSPSLLAGLLIAGLLHVYLPAGFIHRGLSRPDWRSVMRASLVGVPLPLCSCGVIPTALGLRNEGASKGATVAFMISTPQTGADAILVSSAFLGWPFALFMVMATFVTGLVGGLLVNRLVPPDPPRGLAPGSSPAEAPGGRGGLAGAVRYGVLDLLGAIDLWILVGVLAAALLSTLLPSDYFASQPWSQGWLGMLAVLAIALPLYVCTTGSVPIAASLIAAGLPTGSALVFLMAGPATNLATFGAVYRALGGRVLGIYLGTVIVMSLLLGLLFEGLVQTPGAAAPMAHHQDTDWLGIVCALVLIGLMLWLSARRLVRRLSPPAGGPADLMLRVQGMTCQHCVAAVKRALESSESVEEATPELHSGLVRVRGRHLDASALAGLIEKAGYGVGKIT